MDIYFLDLNITYLNIIYTGTCSVVSASKNSLDRLLICFSRQLSTLSRKVPSRSCVSGVADTTRRSKSIGSLRSKSRLEGEGRGGARDQQKKL